MQLGYTQSDKNKFLFNWIKNNSLLVFSFSDLNEAVTCRHTKFRLLQFEKVHLLYLLSHTVTFLDKFVTVMVWCKILKDWMETGLSYKKGDFTKEPFCETCCLFYAHMYRFRGIKIILLLCTYTVQVNNCEIVVNFSSHQPYLDNSGIVHKFTRIYPVQLMSWQNNSCKFV